MGEGSMSNDRWPQERAVSWQAASGWLFGCNFTPSTAGNQLEMWQASTFDEATIRRELGWAARLGMNTVRVYLHDLLFAEDEVGFMERIDRFLEIAHGYRIGSVLVLLDGVWHPRPRLGAQRSPRPGVHNSMWVQSPGSDVLHDQAQWPRVQAYVQGVIRRFANDSRVVAWDLFNEPDQIDATTLALGSRDRKAAAATALLASVFDWARGADAAQPLTVGLWEYDVEGRPVHNALNELVVEQSDIISFHCYEPRAKLLRVLDALSVHQRPLLCTEWLARSVGSTVDLLQVFAQHGVGAINWGLVDGRTQTRFPWRSWDEPIADDEPWFHEILHSDGSPYDEAEVHTMREISRAFGRPERR